MGRRPRSGQGQRSQPVLRAMSVVLSCVLPCRTSHGLPPRGVLLRSDCASRTVSVSVSTRTPPTVRSDMCQTRRGRARDESSERLRVGRLKRARLRPTGAHGRQGLVP